MKEDPWHDREEEFLTKIEQQCNDYAAHHSKDHMYYNRLSSKFNIPILIISAVNALTAISLNSFLDQEYVSILNAVLSAGTGVLGSIQLYMKLNEKMTNALRASILMKRLALKISKELSVDRAQRSTEGQAFLQECFAEFNTALEQGNPIEKKLKNHLSLVPPEKMEKKMSLMSLANAAVALVGTPRSASLWNEVETSSPSSVEEI
jgi:uncharacterized membrane protein YdfJ with MMPL/SSD domain